MMKLSALLWTVALIASAFAGAPDDKKKSEQEWAKGVAIDFVKAIMAREPMQAKQLLVPELAKVTTAQDLPSPLHELSLPGDRWELAKELMAPDKNELALEVTFTCNTGDKVYEKPLSLRIVKHKDSGQWRIDYFLFGKLKRKN